MKKYQTKILVLLGTLFSGILLFNNSVEASGKAKSNFDPVANFMRRYPSNQIKSNQIKSNQLTIESCPKFR
jgi:hypothetical protein